MQIQSINALCYSDSDFEISEIFAENWIRRKEFSLYKTRERPCSALFFVCTDIEVCFFANNGTTVTSKKGDVVFLPKGSLYFVRVTGDSHGEIDTYTINLRLFDEQREEILLSDRIAVLTNRQDNLLGVQLKKLSDVFHRIEENKVGGKRNLAKTKGEFFLLLDLIADSTAKNQDSYYPIRKGIEVFCDEWNKNEKIEKYAELCGISVTYFYRCFRKWSGSSPVEYRNTLRLSNAESLLRCTDMQIGEISETVGFDDPFYFCRVFSQVYGLSPQKYRKQFQN